MNKSVTPLVVDLDGTLLKTDLLLENFYAMIRQNPVRIFSVPLWLLTGKAHLKDHLEKYGVVDVKSLPYREEFLAYLRQEHAEGRPLVLATASIRKFADAVAGHLGIFQEVLATEGNVNLKGKNKLKALLAKYGEKGFDYAGDDSADLHIFPHARHAILVNPSNGLLAAAKSRSEVQQVFSSPRPGIFVYLKAVRAYQWIKNILLFIPLIASHSWENQVAVVQVILGFVSFSLCASGGYILNDMLDLAADRDHPRKKKRPFASGAISLWTGTALMFAMQIIGLILAASLNWKFFGILVFYCGMSLSYTFCLKTYVLIDVLVLAGLYTLRVFAGGLLIDRFLSFWLMSFSIFIFFSLALVKRCSELMAISKSNKEYAGGRDYSVQDIDHLREMGISSGYMAILIFAFYINSPDVAVLYTHPKALWLAMPVLFYWISRLWLKTGRGEMADDPIVFSIKDRGSRFVLAVTALIVLAAI